MPTSTHTPIEEIVRAWTSGATIQDIADAAGVSRQAISQRLIAAGYSPAARRARKIAARDETADAYRRQRAATVAAQAERREAAVDRFLAIAREFDVSPQTLGSYVAKSGPYARDERPTPYKYAGGNHQKGRGKLPGRQTINGRAIAQRVAEATAPWSPKHISNLAARRDWRAS